MTTAAILSDLHLGGNVSIMRPQVKLGSTSGDAAHTVSASEIQAEFYDRYCQMIRDMGRVDCCFVLGDTTDGVDSHSEGYTLWTTDRRAQVEEAYTLLSMIRTKKYYVVQGSRYHVDSNTTTDLAVCDKLRGTFGTDLAVVLDGLRIHLSHKIGHSRSPASKLTAPATEIAHAELNVPSYGRFDLLLRGHRHDYYDVKTGNGHIVGCPSWKARDHFAATHGLGMPAREIGGLLLHIEKKKGRTVHWVEEFLTPLTAKHQFTEVIV